MIPVFDIVKKITIGIILGLIVVTVFLICNTIRLTIFARRTEIEIMKFSKHPYIVKLPANSSPAGSQYQQMETYS